MIHRQPERSASRSSSSADAPHLLAIEPNRVESAWPLAEPWLALALERTEKLDLPTVLWACQQGDAQLWVAWDVVGRESLGALVTELADHPTGLRVARVLCLGGARFEEWAFRIRVLEEWARAEGCRALELVGRKGWGRVFPDYRPIEYVWSKPLEDV